MSDHGEAANPTPSVVLGTEVDPLVGREVGGYVIEVALGEGGMGLVYQARHPFLGRRFAIKVLRPELAADRLLSSNFVREAQTLSGLKHPHIIDIVGFGPLDDQRQYMVMEFLDGRTLEAELAEQGTLSVARVLVLAEQILDGLEAAHSIDVIHRDLKPSNVFLARISGGAQVVKLLDFGLAKLQPQALAGTEAVAPAAHSTIAGTPDYIAPEQALGRGVSKLSDLYSFGAMLFELLTGAKPFAAAPGAADPIRELLRHHLETRAPELGEAFPEDLGRLVAELLEKDPTKRPQSAQLVRQRLRRLGRELQREETRQAPNPFLTREPGPTPAPAPEPEPLLLAQPPRRLPLPLLSGLVLVLLGAVLLVGGRPAPEKEPPPPPPPQLPLAPLAVAVPEAAPLSAAPPPVLDELEPLPTALRPVAPRPRPPRPAPVSAKDPGAGPASCEPDERWRTAARAHLQELQQLAASDARRFARFEQAEGALTSAIGAAATSAQCAAVDRQIQQLAKEMSP